MSLNSSTERFCEDSDAILQLCRFMDDLQIASFAGTCRPVYQTISGWSHPWKQILTNVLQPLLGYNPPIYAVYGTHEFVVTHIYLETFADIKPVFFSGSILNMDKIKALYIKNNKSKVFATLDESSASSSTTAVSERREISRRQAIIVWPIAAQQRPNLIYLGNNSEAI
ncbi:hypothetical protein BDF19DRAFT_429867 [Syncephalis fuscata]|nr:hypothetical protein BDF19DRAFT_429867 [Syncephalis fuscata]